MKVRYLGPGDVLVAGAVRIRRGETGELSQAQYDALGSKQSRVRVIPSRKTVARAPARAKPKKE